MTAESASKVAQVMLRQNERSGTFEVNFTDIETSRFMAEAFRQLGCKAEVIDEAWCLVKVTLPEKASA
ncbi:MAG: hypothetical protein WAO58_04400 [Fimbriimonadaceae bacterium]